LYFAVCLHEFFFSDVRLHEFFSKHFSLHEFFWGNFPPPPGISNGPPLIQFSYKNWSLNEMNQNNDYKDNWYA
jgi:hypothetical protein